MQKVPVVCSQSSWAGEVAQCASTCRTNMRILVQILPTHLRSQAWLYASVTPVLEGERRQGQSDPSERNVSQNTEIEAMEKDTQC